MNPKIIKAKDERLKRLIGTHLLELDSLKEIYCIDGKPQVTAEYYNDYKEQFEVIEK